MESKVPEEVSQYFRELAKKRKDNHRGFNNPTVVKKAIEARKKNKKTPDVLPEK